MRILLDESLPRDLGKSLAEHEVRTVQQAGWAGLKNGDLLQKAAGQYDVFVIGDRNIEYQQNLSRLPILVIVLEAANNRIESLLPLVPSLLETIATLKDKRLVRLGA